MNVCVHVCMHVHVRAVYIRICILYIHIRICILYIHIRICILYVHYAVKRVFITNVKGTFFGMSESEEASKRRCNSYQSAI